MPATPLTYQGEKSGPLYLLPKRCLNLTAEICITVPRKAQSPLPHGKVTVHHRNLCPLLSMEPSADLEGETAKGPQESVKSASQILLTDRYGRVLKHNLNFSGAPAVSYPKIIIHR